MNYESEAYIGTDGSTKITTTGNEAEIYIDSTTAHQKIDRQSYWGRLKSFLGGVSLGISGINIVAAGFELVQPIVTHQAPNGWSLLQLAQQQRHQQ